MALWQKTSGSTPTNKSESGRKLNKQGKGKLAVDREFLVEVLVQLFVAILPRNCHAYLDMFPWRYRKAAYKLAGIVGNRMEPLETHAHRGTEQVVKIGGKTYAVVNIVLDAAVVVVFTVEFNILPLMVEAGQGLVGYIAFVRAVKDIIGKQVGSQDYSLYRTGITLAVHLVIEHGGREIYRSQSLVCMACKRDIAFMKLSVVGASRIPFIKRDKRYSIKDIGHGHAERCAIFAVFHKVCRAEKPSLSPGHIEFTQAEKRFVKPVVIAVKLVKIQAGPYITAVVGIHLGLKLSKNTYSGVGPGIKGDCSLGIGTCYFLRISVKRLIGPAETTAGTDYKVAAYNYLLAFLKLIPVVYICRLLNYNIFGRVIKYRVKVIFVGGIRFCLILVIPGNFKLGGLNCLGLTNKLAKQNQRQKKEKC